MMSEHNLQDEILISTRKQVCGRWEGHTLNICSSLSHFILLLSSFEAGRKQQQSPAAVWRELHKSANGQQQQRRGTVMMRRRLHQGVVSHPPPIYSPPQLHPGFKHRLFRGGSHYDQGRVILDIFSWQREVFAIYCPLSRPMTTAR